MSFSSIFSLLVFAALVIAGLRVVPPFISNYQLQDSLENLAISATYAPVTEEELVKTVIARADSFGITLTPKQITVHKAPSTVDIAAQYTVVVDLIVRPVELHFEPATSNRNVIK